MTDPRDPAAPAPFDPGAGLLAFLDHVERLPDVIARRRRSYELLAPRPGETIADIGCGAGIAVRELAACVAPGGCAVGIDLNEALLEAAAARATRAGVDVAFHIASAEALPFGAASLHGYRAERLYQHLAEPASALAEARRVLAPGGRIVLVDQDWDAALLDSDDLATTRTILRAFRDGVVSNAIGRQYRRLLLDAGFSDVEVHADVHTSTSHDEYGYLPELAVRVADAVGAVDPATSEKWLGDQRDRGKRGRYFLAMTHFTVSARR